MVVVEGIVIVIWFSRCVLMFVMMVGLYFIVNVFYVVIVYVILLVVIYI